MAALKVALGIGAGPAIGASFARRFAKGGYTTVIGRRHASQSAELIAEIEAAGGRALAFDVDARDEDQVIDLFARIERDVGPIDVALYNAGANTKASILETSSTLYQKAWQLSCFGGFLMGREAARCMLPRGHGTILFTGATASIRGGSGFAAFAGAKFALRALAQSMARELGPQGIHVAHLIVDGGVDSDAIRQRRRKAAGNPNLTFAPDALIDTDRIADAYWMLHAQPRSAWTHELDIRSFSEQW